MTPSVARQRWAKSQPQKGFSLLELVIVVAIILVLVSLTVSTMTSTVRSYRLSSSARQLAASVQMAKIKAMARDARFRVRPDTGSIPHSFVLEFLARGAGAWAPDAPSGNLNDARVTFPTGVRFTNGGISSAPPGQTTAQAAEMRFNTRGLLIDLTAPPGGAPLNGSCFYLQGNTDRPLAVCASLSGKVTVYRLFSGAWEVQ